MFHTSENFESFSDSSLDDCNQLQEDGDCIYYEATSSEEHDPPVDSDWLFSSDGEETYSDNDSSDESDEWPDEDLDDPVVAMHANEFFAEIGEMPAIAG